MAETFHSVSVAKSRRGRQCTWCGEQVQIGDPYKAYQFRDGRETGHVTLHPECYSAMQEMAAEEGGWFSWTEGDFSRGCMCERGSCECEDDE